MVGLYGLVILIAGVVLVLMGVFGIWMAMSTPIQLQPLPLIVLILGLIATAIGWLIFFNTGPV